MKRPFVKPLEFASNISFNGQMLYFGVGNLPPEERLSYSLPPKPPKGAFDVRFSGGWKFVNDYGEIPDQIERIIKSGKFKYIKAGNYFLQNNHNPSILVKRVFSSIK